MKRLMGCKGSHEQIENDGFKICHSGELVNHETRREIVKNDITPSQKKGRKNCTLECKMKNAWTPQNKTCVEHHVYFRV